MKAESGEEVGKGVAS